MTDRRKATIVGWECPEHGRTVWRRRDDERVCTECDLKPVERTYVAVDALRKALWQRVVSGDEHHADMTRMLGYIDAFALTLRTTGGTDG